MQIQSMCINTKYVCWEAKYMNIIKVLSHCSCSNICGTIQHIWGDHSKHYKYSLSLLIVFYLLLIIVMFHPRPSRNVPSGERSGDSAWGEKWSLYCHEWQRETLWFGKNWSGVANLMKYVWTEIEAEIIWCIWCKQQILKPIFVLLCWRSVYTMNVNLGCSNCKSRIPNNAQQSICGL